MMDDMMILECSYCGNTEEFPDQMSRDKTQNFKWEKDLDNNKAIYKCMHCGRSTKSKRLNN